MNGNEINRNGRNKVEAELLNRGAGNVTSNSRGTRKVYLLATDTNQKRTVELRVKTKQKGNWHTTIDEAKPTEIPPNPKDVKSFWVFVDFSEAPKYWIVPDWWIRNDIHHAHQKYLQEHDGHRAENDDSHHHSIDEFRLQDWQDRWDILGIF